MEQQIKEKCVSCGDIATINMFGSHLCDTCVDFVKITKKPTET